MSTKPKRGVSSSSQPTPGTSRATPQKSMTPVKEGKKSPLSPTRYSRLHEKEELASLNDRLACYIDRVRHLEGENSRLTREVQTSQETVNREVTSVKSMYESELSEARKLLDELSREKAKLQIDIRRLYSENEESRNDLEKKTKDNGLLSTALTLAEKRLTEYTAKYNQVVADKKKLAEDNKNLDKEKVRLSAQLAETRKLLEEETLQRVDLENSLQTLREDCTFKEQLHEQQLLETRSKKQVEITEIDGRLTQEYEERLCQSLDEIRDQFEAELDSNRSETKRLYEEKIKSLTSQLSRSSNAAAVALSEVKRMQAKLDELNRRIIDVEGERNITLQKYRDLEKDHEITKAQHMDEFAQQEREIYNLREEMTKQHQEYQDLMDIKVALDLEIAAYRKLLEGEEARLNITPTSTPGGRTTPRKLAKAKRKRTFFEESDETTDISNFSVSSSTKCDVSITEVCPEGKFVKLTNKANKEISLSGWQLIRQAGNDSTAYKFQRNYKLEPGATVTVWSGDLTDRPHEYPENVVMKSQRWFVADVMVTNLLNSDGEQMATAEHKRQHVRDQASSRQEGPSFLPKRATFLKSSLRRQSDENHAGEERCIVM